ncbi:MAG: hypothetical protein ACI923_001200 [Flavobacteriales bacterium]
MYQNIEIMKEEIKDIKVGFGLGQIKFGMERDDVTALLGKASRVDTYAYSAEGDEMTEDWFYDDLGLSVSFDQEENWKLTTLSIESENFVLEGHKIIGMKEADLLSALKTLGFDDLEDDLLADEFGEEQQLISSEEKCVNFWLNGGTVNEVQWSPLFEDDDTIKWP